MRSKCHYLPYTISLAHINAHKLPPCLSCTFSLFLSFVPAQGQKQSFPMMPRAARPKDAADSNTLGE